MTTGKTTRLTIKFLGGKENIMEKSTENINKFEMSCRVISMVKHDGGTGFIRGYIKDGIDIYPGVYIPKSVYREFSHHSRVRIKGHLQTRTVKKDGQYRKIQQLVADSLISEPTLTEEHFGCKGKFFGPSFIRICLQGTVVKVIDNGNWYRYKINVSNNDKSNIVVINMKKLERHLNVKVGDKICAVCTYATPKKYINEEDVVYEDIIVSDLSIVESL